MISAEQIRSARADLGESQTAFAARFGVNQSTIARWETAGVPTRGTAPMLVMRVLDGISERAE